MTHQTSFSQAEFAAKKKTTRREKFLARMEEVIPWSKLRAVLEPHYPKGERGRPPIGLERMLRVYFLQQWYGLADEALEDALYDSQALRGFARIDLSVDDVPDATTLLVACSKRTTCAKVCSPPSTPTSPRAACCCARARWWTPR
jgi:IS5 family transposase